MTLAELSALSLIEGSDPDDKTFHHSRDARVVVAQRVSDCDYIRPGSRIDLCCQVCGERIALGPVSVAKIEIEGKSRACRRCLAQSAGISLAELPHGPQNAGWDPKL